MASASQAAAFPNERSLCESCGYPLKGLAADADCPECGLAVGASHPDERTGPVFEQRPGLVGFVRTGRAVIQHPKHTFRNLRLGGSSIQARQFLLLNAIAASLLMLLSATALAWSIDRQWWLGGEFSFAVMLFPFLGFMALFVSSAVLAIGFLTYIEVAGVAWFSRRRGWRVPLRSAERVACYASVGWLPGAAVLGGVMYLYREGWLEGAWARLGGDPVYGPDAAWVTVFAIAVLAMLGFETLVWVGVRQVKYANTPPDPADSAATSPASVTP